MTMAVVMMVKLVKLMPKVDLGVALEVLNKVSGKRQRPMLSHRSYFLVPRVVQPEDVPFLG